MLLKLFQSYITTHGMTSHNKQNRPLLENAMTVTLKKNSLINQDKLQEKYRCMGPFLFTFL